MIRNEIGDFLRENIGQSAEDLKNHLNDIASAELGETLFPQSDEEIELHNELADILTDIESKLDQLIEIKDFYESLYYQFGTYNPA
jgi:SpoVK/Ycf46/Vps4 family AAA+-type ATPase